MHKTNRILTHINLICKKKKKKSARSTLIKATETAHVLFLSCPLVKKHVDLSGSFLYSQSTTKDMYSKPTNKTELSIPMKTKRLA